MGIIKKESLHLVLLATMVLLITSCASRKDVVYFQNSNNFETLVDKNTFSPKFKVDDLVGIHISTLNPEASVPFNLFRGSQEDGMRPEQVDYLVDQETLL